MRRPTEVRSSISLRHAVAAVLALSAASLQFMHSATAQEAKDVANLSDVNVEDDPFHALSSEPSAASFGFAKPLLETPRTVTFVSEEQLKLAGVSTVADLARLVPGTFTTTRYGLQGGISIRGVSADFYYRGMKRLTQQGHVRTILSAYDNIEVIKGPPSPLYGLGKIGGYANLDPKSGRARTGKYLTGESGYFQETIGSYNKNEMQFGAGVPFKVGDRASAIYLVGLLEDSGSYVRTVKNKQKFIQGTSSVDNVIGNFRLETGGQVQNSITSGAFFTRTTDDMVRNNRYIAGQPMVNLDLNGDGRVGFVELNLASPIGITVRSGDSTSTAGDTAALSSNNRPLQQRFTMPLDANGNPIPLSTYANTIQGVPQSFKDYLNAHGEIQCAAATAMRNGPTSGVAVSAGGGGTNPLVGSRYIPVGFALNPCTVQTVTLPRSALRSNGAFEREQNAYQRMFYFDLINDTNPDFTMKNQFFYDSIDSFKDSWLPYGERQFIHVYEDKFTATKRIPQDVLPDWLKVNTLGSANIRKTAGFIRSSSGDYDTRQDITYNTYGTGNYQLNNGGFYPNTMFWNQLENPTYGTGAPVDRQTKSKSKEMGVGVMADIDFFTNTNLVIGGRIDQIEGAAQDSPAINVAVGGAHAVLASDPTIVNPTVAQNLAYTQRLYAQGGYCQTWSAGCPGRIYENEGLWVKGKQTGKSWSASLSHKLPWGGMVPYVTKAKVTLTLDGANNLWSTGTIAGATPAGANYLSTNTTAGALSGLQTLTGQDAKLIGSAGLEEVGIKGQLFRGKLQWQASLYKQERQDVSVPSDPTAGTEVNSTTTTGWEAGINYQITKKWYTSVAASHSNARYSTGMFGTALAVNARDLGYSDIVASDGTVIPAEALMYGGVPSVVVNDVNNVYHKVPGTPVWQLTGTTNYRLLKSVGVMFNVSYTDGTWANRLQSMWLPATITYNSGVTWDHNRIHLQGNVFNIFDQVQWRGSIGSGNRNWNSILDGRKYEASAKIDF